MTFCPAPMLQSEGCGQKHHSSPVLLRIATLLTAPPKQHQPDGPEVPRLEGWEVEGI